jgi:hypothetical protein
MNEESKIDPKHPTTRGVLRVLGPAVAGVGLVLVVVGVGSFFSAVGSFGPPRYFWCVFLGIPLLFVGTAMCMFGFLGALARYVSGEAAPVQKDTFNYLAGGTREGVRAIASAVGEGLAAGKAAVTCHRCGHGNAAGGSFCSKCGSALDGRERPG